MLEVMCSSADPQAHRDVAAPSPETFQSWRTRCVNYLTHELQTPLMCILLAAADLSSEDFGGSLTPEERQLVDSLTRDSVRLSRTVSDVLAYLEAAEVRDRAVDE